MLLQIFNIDGALHTERIAFVSASSFGNRFGVIQLVRKQRTGFSIGDKFDILIEDLPKLHCKVIYL